MTPSITSTARLLTVMLSLIPSMLAQETITSGLNDITGGTQCPGVLQMTGTASTDGYCCVGGELTLSTCPGWPICTGPGTIDPDTTTLSCATSIPLSASDYSALITSASNSYYNQMTSGGAAPSGTAAGSASATDSAEGTASETGSGSGSPSTTTSAGDAVNYVAPMGMVGGAFLALAAFL